MGIATMLDTDLQHDVLDELKWEPSVKETYIGISVKNGVVTLRGRVSSFWERYAAETAAKRVQGVRAVANELDVQLPGRSQRTDEDIAADSAAAISSYGVGPGGACRSWAVTKRL